MRSDGFTYAEIAATLALNPASVSIADAME
jgi:hypothetical protein